MSAPTPVYELPYEWQCAHRDDLARYVEDHVNPARFEAGLEPISRAHACRMFDLVVEWERMTAGLPHTLDL